MLPRGHEPYVNSSAARTPCSWRSCIAYGATLISAANPRYLAQQFKDSLTLVRFPVCLCVVPSLFRRPPGRPLLDRATYRITVRDDPLTANLPVILDGNRWIERECLSLARCTGLIGTNLAVCRYEHAHYKLKRVRRSAKNSCLPGSSVANSHGTKYQEVR